MHCVASSASQKTIYAREKNERSARRNGKRRRSMLRLYVRSFAQAELAGKDSKSINVRDRSAFKLNLPYLAIDLFALCALY
jgi:hypothetical protein